TDAPAKSGALITAKLAMEEGRDVFAIPRNITDIKYSGTNILIQQGAKLVMHPNDILSEYPYAKRIEPTEKIERKEQPEAQNAPGKKTAPKKKKEKADINSLLEKLSESEKQIAGLLIKKDMQIDEISREISVPVGTLNTRLIMLEMKGVVIKLPGSMYRLKTDQEEG
ncbi:MAG: DNA-processing protein DprA, partial [Clostridia bacterium]|nr:DNA-processing protein DprA [Clostridia bacterium]